MAIPKGTRANFETLKRAFAAGDVALMETTITKTGEFVDALCIAVKMPDGGAEFMPIAIIPRSDSLYHLLTPPE